MYSTTRRLEYLDSVRGLAALAVLLSHTAGAFIWLQGVSTVISLPFLNILFNGKEAVAMFFVLSGFVLSRPYVLPEGGRQIFLPTFYLRRFTRIWLPWFFVFCASMVAQRWIFQPHRPPPASEWLDQFWQVPMNWANFLRQCVFRVHDSHQLLIPQDWSLGVELKASALIPLFVLLATGWRLAGLAVLGLILFFGLPMGHCYASFIMGILLAKYADSLVETFRRSPGILRWILLIAGLAIYESHHWGMDIFPQPNYEKYYWTGTSLGCLLILLSCMASAKTQGWLNWRGLVFLGRVSFSVYLLQFVVILCLLPPMVNWLCQMGLSRSLLLPVLTMVFSTGLTIGLSAITYKWIEYPCIQLGHKLTGLIQQRCLKK